MEVKFRPLHASEIEVRVGQENSGGCTLLLYKDARCDQNILDETVGPMNWQRFHSRENANCTVSIWDDVKQQWIGKEDTGTESRTEAEKGLASDSFKRACVNWGIGRELYTSPRIFIPSVKLDYKEGKNGRRIACEFDVEKIAVIPETKIITGISIRKIMNGKAERVFVWQLAKGAEP